MRVLFVDNLLFEGDESRPWFDLQPHLGLMSLAAVARAAGHEAIIYDPKRALADGALRWSATLYGDIAGAILDHAPDAIGFTALGCNFHCVVQTATALRALRPDLPLLLGGPHATILHAEILAQLSCFDVVVRHEAEEILPRLLAALGTADLDDIPGISWRAGDGKVTCNAGAPKVEALDDLPVPAYDHYPLDRLALGAIRVEAGRGCPFSCTFCSTASFFGRSYRLKSSARLVAEMDMLHARHGFSRFKLNHDLFTVNRRKVLDFCAAVAPRSYLWSCSARVDCVDEALLDAMAAAGCESIYFGIETGSEKIQQSSRKRLDLALVEPVVAATARLGMRSTTSFIIGYPDEDLADQDATLDMAGALHRLPLNVSQIHLLTPEPGTDLLGRHRDSLGLDGRRSGFNLPRFRGDDDALIAAAPELFVTHYHFRTRVPRGRNLLVARLWQQLACLPPESYAFLLDHWSGSLASLAGEAASWWERSAGDGVDVPSDALAQFAASAFGAGAPIVSLLRYAAAFSGELPGCHPLPAAAIARDAAPLAPGASVLRNIHDVPRLGASILAAPSAADAHLVVVPAGDGQPACAYPVDGTTADLLTLLAEPGGEALLAFVDDADVARLRALRIIARDAPEPVRQRACA